MMIFVSSCEGQRYDGNTNQNQIKMKAGTTAFFILIEDFQRQHVLTDLAMSSYDDNAKFVNKLGTHLRKVNWIGLENTYAKAMSLARSKICLFDDSWKERK